MGRSQFACKGKTDGKKCDGILGKLDRFSKSFSPAEDAVSVAHGVTVTIVCPKCGKPRTFSDYTMRIEKAERKPA